MALYNELRTKLLKTVQAVFESRDLSNRDKRQILESIVFHIQQLLGSLDDSE